MNIWESIRSAFSSVVGHKMRSLLTMLGIIIGISSVIMVTALGAGVKDAVFDEINQINTTMIEVYPYGSLSENDLLTYEDMEAISNLNNVQAVVPMCYFWGAEIQLRQPGETKQGSVYGTNEHYRLIENFTMLHGRFFTANDIDNTLPVAVITDTMSLDIFGTTDSVGDKITLQTWYGAEELTIIGIAKLPDSSLGVVGSPLRYSLCFMPVTTINDMFYQEFIDNLEVIIDDVALTDVTSLNITNLLSSRHGNTDKYMARSMSNDISEIDEILNMITMFVALAAAISLLVGSIGVMNIMLVSVKERTREIGIRKSLGATFGNIMFQFLMEAIFITLAGGLIGIVSGIVTANGLGSLLVMFLNVEINPTAPLVWIFIAFIVALIIGLVAGLYPAAKAALLNPIEALRYE